MRRVRSVPSASIALCFFFGAFGCSSATSGDEPSPVPDAALADAASDLGADVPVVTTDGSTADAADASTDDVADTGEPDAPGDAADAAPAWPSCDAKPDAATARTIVEVWAANPITPSFTWVSGATVTAVSFGGCVAEQACQIFLQEGTGATLGAAAKHAIKLFVSKKTAARFTGIAPGDVVDVAAHAWRYDLDGQNELLLQVNDALRGCAKKTGTGSIAPVVATLEQLGTVSAYESTYGPVLVVVKDVSGKPDATPTTTFGLWNTAGFDAGTTEIVSLSPYFLPGGSFTGLTAGAKTDFSSITGVFGLFVPAPGDAAVSKYLQLYPRAMTDVVVK